MKDILFFIKEQFSNYMFEKEVERQFRNVMKCEKTYSSYINDTWVFCGTDKDDLMCYKVYMHPKNNFQKEYLKRIHYEYLKQMGCDHDGMDKIKNKTVSKMAHQKKDQKNSR